MWYNKSFARRPIQRLFPGGRSAHRLLLSVVPFFVESGTGPDEMRDRISRVGQVIEVFWMSCCSIGRILTPLFLGLAVCTGCNSETQSSASVNKLHQTTNFSAAELNAPLNAKAKASGAQVAPPPMR